MQLYRGQKIDEDLTKYVDEAQTAKAEGRKVRKRLMVLRGYVREDLVQLVAKQKNLAVVKKSGGQKTAEKLIFDARALQESGKGGWNMLSTKEGVVQLNEALAMFEEAETFFKGARPKLTARIKALRTVRDPTTWTVLQNDGPNHLGLR